MLKIDGFHFIVPLNLSCTKAIIEEANDKGDWEHKGNGGETVLLLEIKEFFSMNVVISNEKGCEFYVACSKKPIFVDVGVASLNDDWGNTFKPRIVVIGKQYYQKWGHIKHGGMSFVNLVNHIYFPLVWSMQHKI